MLSIKNVLFQAEYARVTGCIDTYLVHMGTGAVYKHGMVELDVPQANKEIIRRIFLPFENCNAQTVEILSRIEALMCLTKCIDGQSNKTILPTRHK